MSIPDKNLKDSLKSSIYESRPLLTLMLLVGVICFLLFKDFIFLKKVYLFKDIGSDTVNMYYPLLVNLSESMSNYGAPYWSFSQGLGQNIFPLWISDLFSNIIMFFSKPNLPKVIVFMELCKIMLCAFIFFKYLQQLRVSNFSATIGGLLYAFTGYVILGGTWIIFSTEAVYVAIILYGFEKWLNEKKWFLFLLGIFLLSLLQPFYLYSYTIFLSLYIIVRFNETQTFNWKTFLTFALKTVGVATLGVAITSFQLLPDVLMLLESPRVGGEAGLSATLKKQSLLGFADDMLRFTTIFRAFGSDILGTGSNFKGWQNYLEAPILYCGILSLVTWPHVFKSINKKHLTVYIILTVAFVLPILFPYFRYLFWAFTGDYYRTLSLVICVLMIMYAIKSISYIEQTVTINKPILIVNALFLLILLYTPKAEYKDFLNNGLRSFAAVLVIAYSVLLYILGSNKGQQKIIKPILLLLCAIELFTFSNPSVNKRDAMTNSDVKAKIGYNDYTVDALQFIKEKDKQFFRVNKDYYSGLAIHSSINDAKAQSYYGTSSYHSFNQKNYIKFLGDLNVIDVKNENSTRWVNGLAERPLLFSLVSGKYWLSKRKENYLGSFGYDSIAMFNDVKVYKNKFSLPFGFTYDKKVELSEFSSMSSTKKDLLLLKSCVVDDENKTELASLSNYELKDTLLDQAFSFEMYKQLVTSLKADSLTITSFKDSEITGNISLKSSKLLFLSIPFDEGWSAKLNNSETKLYRVNSGLTGMLLPAGNNEIKLSFEPRLFKKGLLISFIGLVVLIGLLAYNFLQKRKLAASKVSE